MHLRRCAQPSFGRNTLKPLRRWSLPGLRSTSTTVSTRALLSLVPLKAFRALLITSHASPGSSRLSCSWYAFGSAFFFDAGCLDRHFFYLIGRGLHWPGQRCIP